MCDHILSLFVRRIEASLLANQKLKSTVTATGTGIGGGERFDAECATNDIDCHKFSSMFALKRSTFYSDIVFITFVLMLTCPCTRISTYTFRVSVRDSAGTQSCRRVRAYHVRTRFFFAPPLIGRQTRCRNTNGNDNIWSPARRQLFN